jgi:2-amino-4,5-dihydroxy-6-oxo-7-(phosphonooxy)heptanoate synthase
MTSHHHFARELRLQRLFRHNPATLMIVPLDHSISDGPVVPRHSSMDQLAAQLADSNVDAIVVHKGAVRHIRPIRLTTMSLIVHLNASTAHALDPDAKYLVTGVEEALRLGADAVSVHVNVGSLDERQQIGDLASVAGACDRWNLPLLAMMYPRGPKISNHRDPQLVAHAAILAADLGADIVKTLYVGSVAEMMDVTVACPVPLILAGGPRMTTEEQVVEYVGDVLLSGAAGVAMGRNIFQSGNPRRLAGIVARLVHDIPDARFDHFAEGRRRELEQVVLA